MGKKKENQHEKTLAEEEAIRLKILAHKKFNSSKLSSAFKDANHAYRLCPTVEGVSEMAATFRILHTAATSGSLPDWYRILDLEPFSHINSVKNQYKKLALLLQPDKNSLEASGEALNLVHDAFHVLSDTVRRKEYDGKLRVALQAEAAAVEETDEVAKDTFLTKCSHCRLISEFDRKHIEQSLVCPSCKQRFKALDAVADEEVESSAEKSCRIRVSCDIGRESNTNSGVKRKDCNVNDTGVEEEITLAEMRQKLKKKTEGNKKSKVREEKNNKEERQKLKKKTEGNKKSKVREEKNNKEERLLVLRNGDMEVMEVEESEFYDFDRERAERSFKNGQVWAIYDDDDGMPRHYGLIEKVVSVNPFEVNMSWLNFQNNDDQSLIAWEKKGFHVSCGRFRASRKDKINLVNVFSHIVKYERVAREIYRIYPHKGSIWALYKEGSSSNRCYQIVMVLTSYSERDGISMVHLEKVGGFKTVFRRKDSGHLAVKRIEKFDYRQFSHQIPARELCDCGDIGVPDHLKSCWELDPAALPPDLLTVEPLS